MKHAILKILSNSNLINKYFSGIGTIFMLHRVHPFEADKLPPNENMKVSPQFLENLIIELKSKGYEFINLDRLHEILVNRLKVEKQIIFTLDDGYKDNYEIAYPVFKKHNVPFTIYITTSFPEKTANLWWYILEDLIIDNCEITLADGSKYNCKTKQNKIDTFLEIRERIISFEQENFSKNLNELFSNYKIDWRSKCNELSMNWDQIQELSKDPLVTIGGHTKNHFALNKLSQNDIIDEIEVANRLIENQIGKKIEHFAYPFGSSNEIGQKEFNIVKKLDFKTSTTTRQGNIYQGHRNYLECLPRIMLTENFAITDLGKVRRKRKVTL
jgi:peptidoglycan/xylan/chitin deacetylase (PgdA/CDA1 family)